jgi:shikimate kinase
VAARADQIVLVGLPGSGKSTVGPLLAHRLGWRFVDLDTQIEAVTGKTVPQIFAQLGEAEFRRIERELTAGLGCEPNLVLAAGGGWILHNELSRALVVWLKTDPHEAIDRMGEQANTRPLLQPDPFARMTTLLKDREQFYKRADIHIDTNGKTAETVAAAVALAVESKHGKQEKR